MPESLGGADLPAVAMLVGINEELGKTNTSYTLPLDIPNLYIMLMAARDGQQERYQALYSNSISI